MILDRIIHNKKLLIFDMDGTLLDSMKLWKYLGRIYLQSKGKLAQDNLEEVLDIMTLNESASYLKSTYNLNESLDIIENQILDMIEDKYLNEIPLKEGVKEYLIQLNKMGYKMCILTTSQRPAILHLFDKVYTDKDFELSKRNPQIYLQVCRDMNEKPQDTVVFEDALYAVESAKLAHCKVVGIYDEYYKDDWNKIVSISDESIYSFEDVLSGVKKV